MWLIWPSPKISRPADHEISESADDTGMAAS
jgi:hypothetical protein